MQKLKIIINILLHVSIYFVENVLKHGIKNGGNKTCPLCRNIQNISIRRNKIKELEERFKNGEEQFVLDPVTNTLVESSLYKKLIELKLKEKLNLKQRRERHNQEIEEINRQIQVVIELDRQIELFIEEDKEYVETNSCRCIIL